MSKRLILIVIVVTVLFSGCSGVGNYYEGIDFFIIKQNNPVMATGSTGEPFSFPQLESGYYPGDCIIASFKIDYDSQPTREYITISELVDIQKIVRYGVLYQDSVCSNPAVVPVTLASCFSNVLFGGASDGRDAKKNIRYQFAWTTSSVNESIPVLYLSASETDDNISNGFAVDLYGFIQICRDYNKVKDQSFTFNIKCYNGEEGGKPKFIISQCSIFIEE